MRKSPIQENGKTYHYILTIQDVFSRYLWLRPLERKSSNEVARELGISDNGGEFKKAVQKLCENLNIRIIRGSPYHPQSQGKVERSHRSLRKKIMFDLLQLSKKGVNWVSSLQEYQKLLNEDSKDVLGKQSPFQAFYGRASNAICNFVKKGKVSLDRVGSSPIAPHKSDMTTRREQVKRIRRRAKKANDVWDVRYIKRRVKNNPPSMTLDMLDTVRFKSKTPEVIVISDEESGANNCKKYVY
ncbi:Retrovirus-related Pol polyprotein from transposon 412 [Exaiptasia diaphana]|nr:Retrovirus-related Pol polyprotein from transposon 412 [Exaiptasia diaphana]